MCFPQCVPGAAGCSIVVQEPSTMHHNFEQICNHKLFKSDRSCGFRLAIHYVYGLCLPLAKGSRQKLLLHQTAACIGAQRYTLHQVANPDTRNRYPPVRLPNNRLFLGWNSRIYILRVSYACYNFYLCYTGNKDVAES